MKPLIIDTETTGVRAHEASLLGVATYNGKASYISTPSPISERHLVGQNLKYDLIILSRHGLLDVSQIECVWDTMIAEYLLDIKESRKLETMVSRYFGEEK
jgi:DNA polymerase I-like protein with 3'-5' exonuclease and polymerase domains